MPTKPKTKDRPWLNVKRDRKPHEDRGNKDPRYKEYRWYTLRKIILRRDDYTCQECLRNGRLKKGRVCDHISIQERERDFWNPNNLQILCDRCHNRKSQRERGVG